MSLSNETNFKNNLDKNLIFFFMEIVQGAVEEWSRYGLILFFKTLEWKLFFQSLLERTIQKVFNAWEIKS